MRNTANHPPQIAKLACVDCSRTDFSSLQGLLNHCRLSHKREFGSHDECVQCCAVLVEGLDDQAWVVANGTEVGGITIPGLRRLFEIAVGGSRQTGPLLSPKKVELPSSQHDSHEQVVASSLEKPADSPHEEPAYITRTLGFHADTPALASFLGRAPNQRQIHSYDEEQNVDIFSDGAASQSKKHWRMVYSHRNKARSALDAVVEVSPLAEDSVLEQPPPPSAETASLPQGPVSRFHIIPRVSIRDLSMWLSPSKFCKIHECPHILIHADRRAKMPEGHTHRWRLHVSAPSYVSGLHYDSH